VILFSDLPWILSVALIYPDGSPWPRRLYRNLSPKRKDVISRFIPAIFAVASFSPFPRRCARTGFCCAHAFGCDLAVQVLRRRMPTNATRRKIPEVHMMKRRALRYPTGNTTAITAKKTTPIDQAAQKGPIISVSFPF
jgi:hypothetical protein